MRFPSLFHTSLFSSFFLPSSLSLFNFVYFIYFFSPFLLYTYINSTGSKLIFMQIRAFKARGFFVHWFTPVYTRLKHGYVDFSPRNPRRSLPAYVSLNQPRDIDSISTNTASLPFIDIAHDLSAWFSPSFFFIFFIFISFFFIRYLSLLLGLGSNYEGRDVARVGFKLCTRLRVIAARNWICFAWNRIDWLKIDVERVFHSEMYQGDTKLIFSKLRNL